MVSRKICSKHPLQKVGSRSPKTYCNKNAASSASGVLSNLDLELSLKVKNGEKKVPIQKFYSKLYLIGRAFPRSDYYDFLSLSVSIENKTLINLPTHVW